MLSQKIENIRKSLISIKRKEEPKETKKEEKTEDYFKNGNSKIRYSSVNNDLPCNWWLRTPQVSNDTSFCRVSPTGEVNTYNARYSQGLTPAFIIS